MCADLMLCHYIDDVVGHVLQHMVETQCLCGQCFVHSAVSFLEAEYFEFLTGRVHILPGGLFEVC
jgi:hypothetical protein